MEHRDKTVAVFGATGRTGIPTVQVLLDAGYQVRAQVRDPKKLPIQHAQLTLLQGDVLDAAFVQKAVEGASAIISVIGHVKGSDPRMQRKGTAHMIAAMRHHGIRRIISLTGAGIPAEGDQPRFPDKMIRFVMNTFFKDLINDGKEHAQLLRNSGLDYTIVRGPRLTEKPRLGTRKVGMVGEINTAMTRADLADFLVDILEDPGYFRREPAVSN